MILKLVFLNNFYATKIYHSKKNEYSFIYCWIKKTIFCIVVFVLYILSKNHIARIKGKLKNYSKGRQFLDNCLINLHVNNYTLFYNAPKYSIVIPAYNCENTIYYPIISIQNQNLSEYEIILINDFSTDNTSKVIESFKERDKRIKIITNKRNFGALYSRCIGTLISKGEYIFALDNDDMIFGEDILDYFYRIAKEERYDIIGFKAVNAKSYYDSIKNMEDLYIYYHSNNFTIFQPELRTWLISINGKYNQHDVTLWGKIYKSKLYKDAINILGKKKYSTYMSWAEDSSMNYIIFNIAESFKFIQKYGILHLLNKSTATFAQPINNKFFGELFLVKIIFDYSNQNSDKNYSVFAALYILKTYFKYRSIINNYNLAYFNNIIFEILQSKYISKLNKYKLITSFQNFLFRSLN